ncbi:MAG TPA: nucleotidyltransferase family protein, partial [Humisphaera sp.]|nr:nucleotidyltransferase family protein [Humisphaera sp.]
MDKRHEDGPHSVGSALADVFGGRRHFQQRVRQGGPYGKRRALQKALVRPNSSNHAVAATSTEAQLLLACARVQLDANCARLARHLLGQQIDWDAMLSLAARHRVRPLLYASLSALHDERIPSSAMDALQVFAGNNARRNLFLIGSLFRLLDLFQANRIPAAAFKGPMLAMGAYGNAALREAGDIDLLV